MRKFLLFIRFIPMIAISEVKGILPEADPHNGEEHQMSDKRIYCLLAEFKGPKDLIGAASNIKKEGYINFDCFTPFPVHGLDDAMGLSRSIIGYIVDGV